jgi:hypothetical protein
MRPQYVSKIETGAIQLPDGEFLTAFAKLANKPRQELEELARAPDEGQRTVHAAPASTISTRGVVRIGTGHCVWASPVLLAAIEGRLAQFQVCSFKNPSADDGLGWIQPRQFPSSVPGSSGFAEGLHSLSAVDVLRLLEDGVVDIGFVPGQVVDDNEKKSLYRVGCIVDSWTGCSFVCREKFWPEAKTEATSEDLARKLVELKKNGDDRQPKPMAKYVVALEDKTIAAQILKDGLDAEWPKEHAGRLWYEILQDCLNSDFAKKDEYRSLENDAQKVGVELAGIITWEPHATWLCQTTPSQDELKNLPLKFASGKDGRASHLTFELVIRRSDVSSPEPRSQELRRAIVQLMLELRDCAQRLNGVDRSMMDVDRGAVENLGRYFDLIRDPIAGNRPSDASTGTNSASNRRRYEDITDTLKAIGGVRFTVHFHPEAIVDMGFKPR